MNPLAAAPSPNPSAAAPSAAPRPNGRRRPRRWLPWLGAVALVALLALGLRPQPVAVETARVDSGTLRATVNEEGRTRIRQRFVVSAPVAGNLRRIALKPGAEVSGGRTVIALIDPALPSPLDARSRSQAEARREAAAAQLEKAREAHRFASLELRRFQQLFADRTVSAQELESVQWREASAAKERSAAESELRQAEAQLAEFVPHSAGEASPRSDASPTDTRTHTPVEILAPVDGKVLRVFEESARSVTPGTPLVEVGDPTDLEVVVEVLSRDGAALAPGTPVELLQWGGEKPLAAKVRLVEPAAFTKVSALGVEEQRVNVVADLLDPPATRPGLGDNFRVEARILVWETDRTLKVPAGALFRQGQRWAAFVVENGRTVLRQVEAGRTSGVETQVVGGLSEGDEVVLYPGDRIREGMRIRAVKI